MPKKLLFVGLGGAGQRHLRILRSLLPDAEMLAFRSRKATPLLSPDFKARADATLESAYGVRQMDSLEAALAEKPDLAVISTPSALHLPAMLAAAQAGVGLLVEKPWSHDLEGFLGFASLVLAKKLPFFISFQRRFHPQIAKVARLASEGGLGRLTSASFYVRSYVPAWHPYEDWRSLYAVRKELGGGVLLTEIHEIDLCCWMFGQPDSVYCRGGAWAQPGLDVEDTAELLLSYPGFSAHISLCFFHKQPGRAFRIEGEQGWLDWNAEGNRLAGQVQDKAQIIDDRDAGFANDDMFLAQAQAMLADFNGSRALEQLRAAWLSQAVVLAAKSSMESGRAEPILPFPTVLS